MKLKRKSDGAIIDLEGEWSEVKPEEWEDVTGECEVAGHDTDTSYYARIMHRITPTGLTDTRVERFYRYRKISAANLPHDRWAFIIERRKS